ncbi:hypothetical protein ADUPG1_008275 [Aduncisulcus paluster]|uniref:SPRY domain-containing protein n=1 Tax=Aduncisulcus paluster TaxID=2918883 RepID=A0ABQ5KSP2_9EUKA|nr:hypothetical protein ADUPG1_008275 [Aduncisulcus paluster]
MDSLDFVTFPQQLDGLQQSIPTISHPLVDEFPEWTIEEDKFILYLSQSGTISSKSRSIKEYLAYSRKQPKKFRKRPPVLNYNLILDRLEYLIGNGNKEYKRLLLADMERERLEIEKKQEEEQAQKRGTAARRVTPVVTEATARKSRTGTEDSSFGFSRVTVLAYDLENNNMECIPTRLGLLTAQSSVLRHILTKHNAEAFCERTRGGGAPPGPGLVVDFSERAGDKSLKMKGVPPPAAAFKIGVVQDIKQSMCTHDPARHFPSDLVKSYLFFCREPDILSGCLETCSRLEALSQTKEKITEQFVSDVQKNKDERLRKLDKQRIKHQQIVSESLNASFEMELRELVAKYERKRSSEFSKLEEVYEHGIEETEKFYQDQQTEMVNLVERATKSDTQTLTDKLEELTTVRKQMIPPPLLPRMLSFCEALGCEKLRISCIGLIAREIKTSDISRSRFLINCSVISQATIREVLSRAHTRDLVALNSAHTQHISRGFIERELRHRKETLRYRCEKMGLAELARMFEHSSRLRKRVEHTSVLGGSLGGGSGMPTAADSDEVLLLSVIKNVYLDRIEMMDVSVSALHVPRFVSIDGSRSMATLTQEACVVPVVTKQVISRDSLRVVQVSMEVIELADSSSNGVSFGLSSLTSLGKCVLASEKHTDEKGIIGSICYPYTNEESFQGEYIEGSGLYGFLWQSNGLLRVGTGDPWVLHGASSSYETGDTVSFVINGDNLTFSLYKNDVILEDARDIPLPCPLDDSGSVREFFFVPVALMSTLSATKVSVRFCPQKLPDSK